MTIDLNDMMRRIGEIQGELLSVSVDTSSNPLHVQEGMPYFSNRLLSIALEPSPFQQDEELVAHEIRINMRMVLGHVTEGIDDEIDERLFNYIPILIEGFNGRPRLQSSKSPTAAGSILSAFCTGCNGIQSIPNTGSGGLVIATDFTLIVLYNVPRAYVYF